MIEARPVFHPQYPAQNGGDLLNSAAQEAIAPVRDGIRLEQARQALDKLFNRRVSVADAEVSMPGRYTAIEGIHAVPAPIELAHQSPIALVQAHPPETMGGAIFDQSTATLTPKTGLDYVTANASGLPAGMEGELTKTPAYLARLVEELEARQQKESFAALSGPEKLSVRMYDLVLAAEKVPQTIRDTWENMKGWLPRFDTKVKVALSAAASMTALAACGGAVPKAPEPTSTPRIVQTVDVVKPTATATTPFETPTPPVVTKEQLANVLIQQDTYTADVIESWKGDMTPTQLLARKVLKGELGPEDDAAEVRSMSYSMKNAGGFSFDIAASASDQSKMRIGFVSPDSSLQMRNVRAVQEQNGAVSLLMTQEGKILVIARKSPDGTAFVINPADASGVIKKIGDNSPELSLGKDIIVIPPSPTPGPKQPNLDLLAYLFPPQIVKAESPPTPSPTTGTVFSDTGEARASATPFTTTATVTAPITPGNLITEAVGYKPSILTEIMRAEGVSDTTYTLNPKESGGVRQIDIANITFADGKTARPDFTPTALDATTKMALSALVINERIANDKSVPDAAEMPDLIKAMSERIAKNEPVPVTLARVAEAGSFGLKPGGVKNLQPRNGAISIKIVNSDSPPVDLPLHCDVVKSGESIKNPNDKITTLACVDGDTIILGADPSIAISGYATNPNSQTVVGSRWASEIGRAAIFLIQQGGITVKKLGTGTDGGKTFGGSTWSITDLQYDWAALLQKSKPTGSIPLALPSYEKFVHLESGVPVIDAKFKIN